MHFSGVDNNHNYCKCNVFFHCHSSTVGLNNGIKLSVSLGFAAIANCDGDSGFGKYAGGSVKDQDDDNND